MATRGQKAVAAPSRGKRTAVAQKKAQKRIRHAVPQARGEQRGSSPTAAASSRKAQQTVRLQTGDNVRTADMVVPTSGPGSPNTRGQVRGVITRVGNGVVLVRRQNGSIVPVKTNQITHIAGQRVQHKRG